MKIITLDNHILWIRLVITSCDNQPDGVGTLKMDDGTVFLPNDIYELDRETFRLYYTSNCTDQQAIDITVYDNFGQRYDLSFSWTNQTDKSPETTP